MKGFFFWKDERDIGWINKYFGKYNMEALNHILSLRINDLILINENIRILSGIFISDTENNLENLIKLVIESKE